MRLWVVLFGALFVAAGVFLPEIPMINILFTGTCGLMLIVLGVIIALIGFAIH